MAAAKRPKRAAPVKAKTARKAPAKKSATKTAKKAARPPAKNAAKAKRAPPKTARAKAAPAAAEAAPATPPPAKKAARRPAGAPRVEKTRVVIAMDVYEPSKDSIKAPFKQLGMKWNFLGEGKGLYKRPDGGIHCFTQFKDDGVHYSVWGDDKTGVAAVLAAWHEVLGAEGYAKATAGGAQAAAEEQKEKETEAVRLWRLAEPQRRPGEPDFFFDKRMAEWQAKRPA